MKTQLLAIALILPMLSFTQNTNVISPIGAFPSEAHFEPVFLEKGECFSESDYEILKSRIEENKNEILRKNPNAFNRSGGGVLFIEPIQPKAGFNDYGYHTINYLVDHNPAPNNNLLDYFCGNRTYDWASGNHGGTDYILWPYPWKRMQEEIMEIRAAADGIIVDKRDGFFDLNCQNNGNPNWNGIVLEHADGTQTIYLHFKNGGITSKSIGDNVSQGEFLGLAGSSGSSNIPHLHFEVRDSNNDLIDPFEGACNNMNADSRWENQEDYYVSKINRISTHYTTTFDDTCGVVENTYEHLNFVPGDQMVLRLFFRDIKNNVPVVFTITDPNDDVIVNFTWNSNWGQFYATAWAQWFWDITNAWPDGVYNVSVDFEGDTYQTIFGVNTNLSLEDLSTNPIVIYPNPVVEKFNIQSKSNIDSIVLYDISGKLVLKEMIHATSALININHLKSGVYFSVIESEGTSTTKKIIKK